MEQIVANEARNRRRAAGRRASRRCARPRRTARGTRSRPAEAALLGEERRAELLTAVNGLRDEERDVIACRFFLAELEETAAALGVKLGTVKSRTSRALAHLREEVER